MIYKITNICGALSCSLLYSITITRAPAAPTPAPTEAPAQSAADMYFVPAIAGLFVLVIVVLVLVVLLMLKKRP